MKDEQFWNHIIRLPKIYNVRELPFMGRITKMILQLIQRLSTEH
jgi:hypothetical protein